MPATEAESGVEEKKQQVLSGVTVTYQSISSMTTLFSLLIRQLQYYHPILI